MEADVSRARSIRLMVGEFKGKEETEEAIIDILTNIRHLCNMNDLEYDELDRMARTHFREEIRPETSPLVFPH